MLPGVGHSEGGQYGERRRWDFFVEALMGVQPPDRNAPKPAPAGPVVTPPVSSADGVAAQAN
jgi:hypothetical protein